MSAPTPTPATLRLDHFVVISGTIHTLAGLHIGMSKDDLEIGGTDLPVIAHPITREPYIPGSSLKGKLRSLLELKYGRYGFDSRQGIFGVSGEPCRCARADCPVCRLFGPHKAPRHDLGPTRLLMRDAPLAQMSREMLQANKREDQANPFVGLKSENSIDRRTGVASNPRTQEVVPEGVDFVFECCLRVFVNDDERRMLELLNEALTLLELDALGAGGSRGCGKVRIMRDEPQRRP